MIIMLLALPLACCHSPQKGIDCNEYLATVDSGLQTGGIKMVEISTPNMSE